LQGGPRWPRERTRGVAMSKKKDKKKKDKKNKKNK
jgi:hypothetical protein